MGYGRSTNPEVLSRHRLISLARQRAYKALAARYPEDWEEIHAAERRRFGITEPCEPRQVAER